MKRSYFDTLPNDILHYIAGINNDLDFEYMEVNNKKFIKIQFPTSVINICIRYLSLDKIENDRNESVDMRWGIEPQNYKKRLTNLYEQENFIKDLANNKDSNCFFEETCISINNGYIRIATENVFLEIPLSDHNRISFHEALTKLCSSGGTN
jgi:hypothetical protein